MDNNNNINNFVWTDGIELALNEIKAQSLHNSDYHKLNYYFFKGYLKYFRIPTIVLSGMNSVFSVGLQPYISQGIISVLCCSISLICGIIASIELFLGIQNMMDKELVTSKDFFVLASDIFKTLSVERQYRTLDGKIYLDYIHTKYCNLIQQSNLLNTQLITDSIPQLEQQQLEQQQLEQQQLEQQQLEQQQLEQQQLEQQQLEQLQQLELQLQTLEQKQQTLKQHTTQNKNYGFQNI